MHYFINKRPTGLNVHLSIRLRLYTDFMSEGLIFVYQQPHHRINDIIDGIGKQHHTPVNVPYIDRAEDTTYSL